MRCQDLVPLFELLFECDLKQHLETLVLLVRLHTFVRGISLHLLIHWRTYIRMYVTITIPVSSHNCVPFTLNVYIYLAHVDEVDCNKVSGIRVSGIRVSGIRVSGIRVSGIRVSGYLVSGYHRILFTWGTVSHYISGT